MRFRLATSRNLIGPATYCRALYLVGSLLGALLAAYVAVWIWGALRNENGDRARSALSFSKHPRTLWLASTFYALAFVARLFAG
jgi:hypothetical protein